MHWNLSKGMFALILVLLATRSLAENVEDPDLLESNRDPPRTISVFLKQTYKALSEMAFDNDKYPYDHEFTRRLFTEGAPSLREVALTILLALGFILFRYFSEPRFRRLVIWLNFKPEDVEKAPEGMFRSLYYCFITVYGAYISYFSGRYNFIQQPCEVYNLNVTWDNYFQQEIPADIWSIYWIQFSYYLSGVYMELYMDKRRKDSTMMLLHHFVTLALMYFSYMGRYFKHGCIIFFLNDISDAILETGKICLYFNSRGGVVRKYGEMICNVVFFFFTVTWFYFRIYLYCVRLLHSSNWCAYIQRNIWRPRLYTFFNFLLFTLYIMQMIWSYYIIKMCVRLITGQDTQLEDIRDKEICEKNTNAKTNGFSKNKKKD